MQRRRFVQALGTVCALGLVPGAHAQALPLVTVYKSPACGCCGEWVAHMRASGFRVEVRDNADVSPVKRVKGLAVAGMVPGSPGMAGAAQPYETLAFDATRSWIFQRH